MEEMSVIRLGLILAVQAEIEGMKAENKIHFHEYEELTHTEEAFKAKAEELRNISYCHNEQL